MKVFHIHYSYPDMVGYLTSIDRYAVGIAETPEDLLATLQKQYKADPLTLVSSEELTAGEFVAFSSKLTFR